MGPHAFSIKESIRGIGDDTQDLQTGVLPMGLCISSIFLSQYFHARVEFSLSSFVSAVTSIPGPWPKV